MPAVTQQHQDEQTNHSAAGKKRRRDDEELAAIQRPNTLSSYDTNAWKPISHGHIPADHHHNNLFSHAPHHNYTQQPQLPQHNHLRKPIFPSPKRLREFHSHSPCPSDPTTNPQNLQSPPPDEPTSRPRPVRQESTSAQLLARCHICFRKPTRKADLDSFAACEGCGQRTCFVCLRECEDWRTEQQKRWGGYGGTSFTMSDVHDGHDDEALARLKKMQRRVEEDGRDERNEARREGGREEEERKGQGGEEHGWAEGGHRGRICSRCCVERGPDGDVVCLGCLPFVEG